MAATVYGAPHSAYGLSQRRSHGNGITHPSKTLKRNSLYSRINPHCYEGANNDSIKAEGGKANEIKDVFRMSYIVAPLDNNQPGSDEAANDTPEKEAINSIL